MPFWTELREICNEDGSLLEEGSMLSVKRRYMHASYTGPCFVGMCRV